MTESLAWALWGISVALTAVALWLLWLRDSRMNDDDAAEMVGLDELMERGSQDDATAEELLHWGLLHDITMSPLVAIRAALEEHEPPTWEQKQALMAVRVAEQERRCGLVCTDTQRFEAIAADAGFPVVEHGPIEPQRSAWDKDAKTWVPQPIAAPPRLRLRKAR